MGPGPEPAVMHEYRHLLRTAPADWQETAHRHALTALGPDLRAVVLGEVRRLLLTGTRLRADDVPDLARLLVLAERRHPRVVLDGMSPRVLRPLAAAVVDSPTGRLLRVGLELWDGRDPRPPRPVDRLERHDRAWCGEWGTRVAGDDLGSAWLPTPPPRRG